MQYGLLNNLGLGRAKPLGEAQAESFLDSLGRAHTRSAETISERDVPCQQFNGVLEGTPRNAGASLSRSKISSLADSILQPKAQTERNEISALLHQCLLAPDVYHKSCP